MQNAFINQFIDIIQLMPLPLTVSCSSKIQIGFTHLVPAHPGSPGQRAVKRVRVFHYTTQLNTNKSVFSFLRQLTTWHCPHSPATRRAAVHHATAAPGSHCNQWIICPLGPQQQTCNSGVQMGQTYSVTHGQTDALQLHIDPAPHTMHTVPIMKSFE